MRVVLIQAIRFAGGFLDDQLAMFDAPVNAIVQDAFGGAGADAQGDAVGGGGDFLGGIDASWPVANPDGSTPGAANGRVGEKPGSRNAAQGYGFFKPGLIDRLTE